MTETKICEACGKKVAKSSAEVGYKVVQDIGREYFHPECIEKIKQHKELEYREKTEVQE